MEVVLKRTCPVCGGSLSYFEYVQSGNEDGELVNTEFPCPCALTPTPGFVVIGTADISDLDVKLNDIMQQNVDILEKLNE